MNTLVPLARFLPLLFLLLLPAELPAFEEGERTHRDVSTRMLSFEERSPLTRDIRKFCSRFENLKPPRDYQLSKYRFEIYYPKRASGNSGLIINIPFQKQTPTAMFADALDRHNLIYAGLHGTTPDTHAVHRMCLALDLLHNLREMHEIDARRIYLSGKEAGSQLAIRLAILYPETFKGGLFRTQGVWWFRDGTDEGKTAKVMQCPEPAGKTLATMKRDGRYAFWTDFPYGDAPRQHFAFQAFRDKGLAAFWQACNPSRKNRCPTAYANRAFMFLDSRLKTAEEIRAAHTPRGERTLQAPCPGCGGNGRLDWVRCGPCLGTGRIGVMHCADCRGTRYVRYSPAPACRLCDGKGFRMQYRQPEVPLFCQACLSRGYRLENGCANETCGGEGCFISRSTPAQRALKKERKQALLNGDDNKIVSFCETCRGMGRGLPHCPSCDGSGFAKDPATCPGQIPPPCMDCSATGWRFETCKACSGLGAVWESYGPTEEDIEKGIIERAYYADEKDKIIAKADLKSRPTPSPASAPRKRSDSPAPPPASSLGTAGSVQPDGKGWLGILTKQENGVLSIVGTVSGSPAAEAKLASGDVLAAFQGNAVTRLSELRKAVSDVPPGEEVLLKILRNGESMDVTIRTASQPRSSLGTSRLKSNES